MVNYLLLWNSTGSNSSFGNTRNRDIKKDISMEILGSLSKITGNV